jgi:hypothetical protein
MSLNRGVLCRALPLMLQLTLVINCILLNEALLNVMALILGVTVVSRSAIALVALFVTQV